jgi:hypothetical protein
MSNAKEMIPYTRAELQEAMDRRWPERGVRCDRCKTLVPQFAELLDVDRARIVRLILEGRPVLAQAELEACTGAPPRFAKIWVLHSGRPSPRFLGPPCPLCGKALASSRAKQCLHCHADCTNAAQQAVEADGRTSSPPAPSFLSPVVKYHGLARRYPLPLGF